MGTASVSEYTIHAVGINKREEKKSKETKKGLMAETRLSQCKEEEFMLQNTLVTSYLSVWEGASGWIPQVANHIHTDKSSSKLLYGYKKEVDCLPILLS